MSSIKITSITGAIHDLSCSALSNPGQGGYPYKIVVRVSLDAAEFKTLCPIVGKASRSICGYRAPSRDLGSLVRAVNFMLHRLNPLIPAYNPSIDSRGETRAKGGIKTLEFVYFLASHETAEKLGFELMHLRNGECLPKYGQYVELMREAV